MCSELATTIKDLGNDSKRAGMVFDEGVLQSLYKLGSVVEGEEPKTLEIIAPRDGNKKRLSAIIEKSMREMIARHLSGPRKAYVHVDGTLDMADFKQGDKRCRIDPPNGPSIVCAFDDDLEDSVYFLLRKSVRVSGVAIVSPQTGKIETLNIDTVEPLPSLALGEDNFFASHSIRDLAELQKVIPIKNSKALGGGIPDSEDLDEFLRDIYESRR